jgi:hypothetical protein
MTPEELESLKDLAALAELVNARDDSDTDPEDAEPDGDAFPSPPSPATLAARDPAAAPVADGLSNVLARKAAADARAARDEAAEAREARRGVVIEALRLARSLPAADAVAAVSRVAEDLGVPLDRIATAAEKVETLLHYEKTARDFQTEADSIDLGALDAELVQLVEAHRRATAEYVRAGRLIVTKKAAGIEAARRADAMRHEAAVVLRAVGEVLHANS